MAGIDLIEQLREPPERLGAEDQVDMAVGCTDFFRYDLLLGHAPAQADGERRVLLLGVDQLPHHAEHLLFRVLPDGAGVDDNHVRLEGVPGEAAAHLPQHPHDALAVRHVLLAPIGLHHGQGAALPLLVEGGEARCKLPLPVHLTGGDDDLCSLQCRSPCSHKISTLIIARKQQKDKPGCIRLFIPLFYHTPPALDNPKFFSKRPGIRPGRSGRSICRFWSLAGAGNS